MRFADRSPRNHPVVRRLDLGLVHLPDWHPRYAESTAQIFAYLIEHPDGFVLFDCGCGADDEIINKLYRPKITPLQAALNDCGLSIDCISAVVVSHLHFDHCGQLPSLAGRPIFVQKAELEVARSPGYTAAKWAEIDSTDCRTLDGDEWLAPGLQIIRTPGHTPGHQSLVVTGGDETTIIGGQCCYRHAGLEPESFEFDNLHDQNSEQAARDSLARLRSLNAERLFLAHE